VKKGPPEMGKGGVERGGEDWKNHSAHASFILVVIIRYHYLPSSVLMACTPHNAAV
jgi:hypothetical protein